MDDPGFLNIQRSLEHLQDQWRFELSNLRDRVHSEHQIRESTEQDLEAARQAYRDLNERFAQSEAELERQRDLCAQFQSNAHENYAKAEAVYQENRKINIEVSELKDQLSAERQARSFTENEVSKALSSKEQELAKSLAANIELSARCAELGSQLALQKELYAKSQANALDNTSAMEFLVRENGRMEQAIVSLRSELDHLKNLFPLKNLLKHKEADIKLVESELASLAPDHPERLKVTELLKLLRTQRERIDLLLKETRADLQEDPRSYQ